MTPKQIIAFAIGPIGITIIGFVTLPFMTWFFNQEDIGRLALLNIAINFSILFFSLGLDQAYVREFYGIEDKSLLLKTTILPGFLFLILVLGILLTLNNIISRILFGIDSFIISLCVVITLIASFLSRFLSLILRMNGRGMAYSMSQLLPKFLFILIIIFYVVLGVSNSFLNLIVAMATATCFVSIIYAWNTKKELGNGIFKKIDYYYLKKLLSFGFPLIFGGIAYWGLSSIGRIFLKLFSTLDELALYSVAVSIANGAVILQSVFSIIWSPLVYKWIADGEGVENISIVNRYMLFFVIVLFCLVGIFSWIILFILPQDYESIRWIIIPCVAAPLLYTLSETTVIGINVSKRTIFSMLSTIIALALNCILSFIFIPLYGASGAAISLCISYWVFLVLRTEFSIYLWKPMSRFSMYIYTFVANVLAIISCQYGNKFSSVIMIAWIIFFLITIFHFRKELRGGFQLLFRRLRVHSK